MGYIYDYDIGSILFFGLTLFFYFYQKRLRNLLDGIFTVMLICSMTAVILDFAAAAMEYAAMQHPVWLLYTVNILFIFSMQSCLPLFFLYSVASVGKFDRFSAWKHLVCAIPYLATMALLFLSPFTDFGICTIDSTHIYRHSATHWMLYVNMGVYVLAGVAVLLKNNKSIRRSQRNVILIFAGVLFVAMVLQLAFPRYLLTASATALAMTAVFYALQSPIDQINQLTGAFSRTLLPTLLKDYKERGRQYTLLLFSIHSFDEFVRLYGDSEGDALLRAYSAQLIRRFKDGLVVYMDTSEFIVVHDGVLSESQVERIRLETSDAIELKGFGTAHIDVLLGAVPGADDDLTAADFMLREMRANGSDAALYASDEYRRTGMMTMGLEASLERMFNENKVELMRSPILDESGAVVIEDVQLCVRGEMAKFVSPKQFVQTVGQCGFAWTYYSSLMAALRKQRKTLNPSKRLCIALLPAAFLQEDSIERFSALATSMGFRPQQFLFAIDESEIASSESALVENIRRLSERGFAFIIDAFAEGYTDMSLVISLPLKYARLHESFTKNAVGGDGSKLLKGLVGVLTDIGVQAICPDVSGDEERSACLAAGARLFQSSTQ